MSWSPRGPIRYVSSSWLSALRDERQRGLLVEVKREELASPDVRSFGRPQDPSAASVSRVRRTMVPIRPGAQAAAPNIKLRPPLLRARPETMLASRIGLAVSCRAAAR